MLASPDSRSRWPFTPAHTSDARLDFVVVLLHEMILTLGSRAFQGHLIWTSVHLQLCSYHPPARASSLASWQAQLAKEMPVHTAGQLPQGTCSGLHFRTAHSDPTLIFTPPSNPCPSLSQIGLAPWASPAG
ncbi:hypothetical protein N8T08_009692 [Aspergillus melleus]|uniref:Uncharacterized protein n=1 Tax=Aspergillus melleus TaxID=138277 RepID=A0ACC3ASZ8_9EURO|nr:hypothetical protein N8T08_009692 [Aspergillus melleus]